MPDMNYHLLLLTLLCMSGTSSSVSLVFEVENSFFSKDPIKLRAVDNSGRTLKATYPEHIRGEEVQSGKRLSWKVAMDSYKKTLKYLCHVTMKTGGGETYVGAFEAFNAAWLKDNFKSFKPEKTIKILWYVFEECATTKLDPEIGGNIITHRWLRIKFSVLNNFNVEVQLRAESEEASTVIQETVPKGEYLRWTHFVTSKIKHFTYQLTASKFVRDEAREVGTVYFFSSNSIKRKKWLDSKTLESWWAVNRSGIQKYFPMSGKYSDNIGWQLSKSGSFHETDRKTYEGRKKKIKID